MMELKQKVKALIVDDDSDYVLGLTDVAALEGIELTHETYWDSAFKMISADPFRFEVIILDRRGQINASSDSADAEHLSKAIEELSRLQGQGYEIPWLINTGFKLDDIRRHAGKAFRKFSDQGEMLERVKTLAIENPENRMKVRFPEVYSLLTSIDASDKTSYHQFLDLFKMIELRASKLTDPRNQIRQLLEAFCKLANKSGIIDRRITHQNGRVNLTACSRWINGKEVHLPNHKSPKWKLWQNPNRFPPHIQSCFDFLVKNGHEGSHDSDSAACSPDLAKALFHALAVLLSWLQKFAKDNPDPTKNRISIHSEKTTSFPPILP